MDIPEEYEIQLMVNDYLINSLLHILYSEGMIHFTLPLELTTTELEIITELKMHGWHLGCPCRVGLYSPSHDQEGYSGDPHFTMTKAHGLNFTITLALDFQCKKTKNATDFSQVMTMLLEPIDFVGKVTLEDNLTLSMAIEDFDLDLDHVIDSQIGNISYNLVKTVIKDLEDVIKLAANVYFAKGRSVYPLIQKLGITFVDLN